MKVLKEQTEFDNIMSCQPQIALERISQKEAQGNRLIYNLFLRGEPTLPGLWYKDDGHYRPKDFIREITIAQPGRCIIENDIACITLNHLEDVLTAYGVLDGTHWDGCRLRAEVWVHYKMQTGLLLGPSDKRLGPYIHITSNKLQRTRSQSTPTRRPQFSRFVFQSGMPMRADVIDIPGLSHPVNAAEHVWHQLSSISDAYCTNDIYPMAAGVSEPLDPCETLNQSMRQFPLSIDASPSTSMYQPVLPSVASPTGSIQAHRRTESCSSNQTISSTRPYRPIIDGSLKGLE